MTATPTTTGFDPYRAWLNVRSDKRPLSAYGILGLKDLESNHTLIKNAANRKRYVLNKHKPDADPDIWERLRRELDDAVELLLDRDRKRLLDASLLRQSPSLKTADAPTSEGEARDITCSKCEQCNAGNQRFCSRCGGPLWQTCPTCGVELTTQDSFCGRCGTDVGAALAEEDEECAARIDEAMQLRAEHRFAGSIKILRAIARTDNSRLDRHARRALELIQELEQEQAQHVRQAEEQLATARERFEEYDYDAVVATLNDVPVTSRGSEMKSLFQEAWTRRGRVEKLLGEVKSLVERNDVVSLARTLDELLDIKPDLTQIQPLTGQVRDRICAMAEKKMRAYAFDQARELLDSVPASTRNEVHAKLVDRCHEVQWMFSALQSSPVIDVPLMGIAARLQKLAPGHEPLKQRVRQLSERAKLQPRTPLAAVPWVGGQEHATCDCPTDWLGGFKRIQPGEGVAPRLLEYPGRFHVAAGLALQGIGDVAAPVNLRPKSGVLGGLSNLGRGKTARTAWGFDLGPSALKVVQLHRDARNDRVVIGAVDVFEHAKCPADAETLGHTIAQFAAKWKVRGAERVVLGLPGQMVLGRFFELPPTMKAKARDAAILYEAKHQIPYPLQELVWHPHVVKHTGEDGNMIEASVALLATHTKNVNERLKPLADQGITVDAVQSECVALHNLMHFEYFDTAESPSQSDRTEAIVAVDVGAQGTNFVVCSSGQLWSRSFAVAGDAFTRALVSRFRLTSQQAEAVKKRIDKAPQIHEAASALEVPFHNLQSEIKRSLERACQVHTGLRIKHLYGLGGGFQVHGLLRFLLSGRTR